MSPEWEFDVEFDVDEGVDVAHSFRPVRKEEKAMSEVEKEDKRTAQEIALDGLVALVEYAQDEDVRLAAAKTLLGR